jgi:hypothetical protein
MAGKRGGNGEDRTVAALLDIHAAIQRMDERMTQGFAELRAELRAQVSAVNQRLDKVIENTGEHWRDLERRVRALEIKTGA